MRIAVVGSGVSGLAATWILNNHSKHEVHLFEANSRPGGHANTFDFVPPAMTAKKAIPVDTGFIVFNPSTYPNFLRFLKFCPNVRQLSTPMTFSVSRDQGEFEWSGDSIFTFFCQPKRLFDPDMWLLLYDILRFNACAGAFLDSRPVSNEISIGQYLDQEKYSDSFRNNYLMPMTAAIWSTPAGECAMNFPARTLIQFLHNHHLLQLTGKPSWLTIKGGSRNYVDSILENLSENQLHFSTSVETLNTADIGKQRPQVELCTTDGQTFTFDHVIMACHSNTTLSILRKGRGFTDEEDRILGQFRWTSNEAILHTDTSMMPRCRSAWSCWNYICVSGQQSEGQADLEKLSLDYGDVLVTLNPCQKLDEDKIVARFTYEHPVVDAGAVQSQKDMPKIQGRRGISYAGAWLGYGFHEDGFTSGIRAVVDYIDGVDLPFPIEDPDRDAQHVLVARVFNFLENTGARRAVGTFLWFWMIIIRAIITNVGSIIWRVKEQKMKDA